MEEVQVIIKWLKNTHEVLHFKDEDVLREIEELETLGVVRMG